MLEMKAMKALLASNPDSALVEVKAVQKNFFDISVEEVPFNKGQLEMAENGNWKCKSWVSLPT